MSDQANRVVYVEQRRHVVVNSPPPLHQFPVNQYASPSPPPPQPQVYHVSRRRKMFSQRAFNGIVFCTRIFIFILAIVSMILILTAPGACFSRYLNGQSISREVREAISCLITESVSDLSRPEQYLPDERRQMEQCPALPRERSKVSELTKLQFMNTLFQCLRTSGSHLHHTGIWSDYCRSQLCDTGNWTYSYVSSKHYFCTFIMISFSSSKS